VQKRALRETLDGRSARNNSALARLGNRRLGDYEVLFGQHSRSGYFLLRPATEAAAAGLPPTPDAAEMAAAAAASDESRDEGGEGEPTPGAPSPTPETLDLSDSSLPPAITDALAALPPPGPDVRKASDDAVPTPAVEQPVLALFLGVPPEIESALAALPPPGLGDATSSERQTLLTGALPAGALQVPAQLPEQRAWILSSIKKRESEIRATCNAVCLLRVRPLARSTARCRRAYAPMSLPAAAPKHLFADRMPPRFNHKLDASPSHLICNSPLGSSPQAVPGVWVPKCALRKVLAGRSAWGDNAMARFGNRRMGGYELLSVRRSGRDFLLLRPATPEAAAGLPPTPDVGAPDVDACQSAEEEEITPQDNEASEASAPFLPAFASALAPVTAVPPDAVATTDAAVTVAGVASPPATQASDEAFESSPSDDAIASALLLLHSDPSPEASGARAALQAEHGAPPTAAAAPLSPAVASSSTPSMESPGSLEKTYATEEGVTLTAGPAHMQRRTSPPPARSQPAPAPSLPRPTAPNASAPTSSAPDLPPEIVSALAALPPPGPDDATAAERQTLLRGALPAGALPTPAQLSDPGAWSLGSNTAYEIKTARNAFCLLRVRWRLLAGRGRATRSCSIRTLFPLPNLSFCYLLSPKPTLKAVPGVWIKTSALAEALFGRAASSGAVLSRLGNRRLGGFEVFMGQSGSNGYFLLRPATDETAVGLLPTPGVPLDEVAQQAPRSPGPPLRLAAASLAEASPPLQDAAQQAPCSPAAASPTHTEDQQQAPRSTAATSPPHAEAHQQSPRSPDALSPLHDEEPQQAALPEDADTQQQSLEVSTLSEAAVTYDEPSADESMHQATAAELPSPPAVQPSQVPLTTSLLENLDESFPPALAAALAALPPPGPNDATPEERRALLAMALPTGALPLPGTRPIGGVWGRKPWPMEVQTMCMALRMLRVRRRCPLTAAPNCGGARPPVFPLSDLKPTHFHRPYKNLNLLISCSGCTGRLGAAALAGRRPGGARPPQQRRAADAHQRPVHRAVRHTPLKIVRK